MLKVALFVFFLGLATFANAQLTANEKNELLQWHFNVRSAANATNIRQLNWNSGIASAAQSFATGCSLTIQANRTANTAQNIAFGTGSTLLSLFNLWANQVAFFNPTTGLCTVNATANATVSNSTCQAYINIVNHATTLFGCGFAACPSANFLVCNYRVSNRLRTLSNDLRPFIPGVRNPPPAPAFFSPVPNPDDGTGARDRKRLSKPNPNPQFSNFVNSDVICKKDCRAVALACRRTGTPASCRLNKLNCIKACDVTQRVQLQGNNPFREQRFRADAEEQRFPTNVAN